MNYNSLINTLKEEVSIPIGIISFLIFSTIFHEITGAVSNAFIVGAIVTVIILLAINVSHHAEMLGEKYGEPYATMILTLSAVAVEVVIIALMMMHSESINLARDTIFGAVMIDINGLLGLAILLGGLKHGEQDFNYDSTNSYLSVMVVAISIAMILPQFIEINQYFIAALFVLMFFIFTRVQTKEHSYFFRHKYKATKHNTEQEKHDFDTKINPIYHSVGLVVSIVIIGGLAELLSFRMENVLHHVSLPITVGALAVALIAAAPEFLTAIRSATSDRMQTVVNIAFGASLATVLLTVPAMIFLTYFIGGELNLILSTPMIVLIIATVLISIIHFQDGQTNILEGSSHLLIFSIYLYLVFTGNI